MAETINVALDPSQSAYIASLPDGTKIGGAFFQEMGGTKVFSHTEIDPAYGGKGYGKQLAKAALDAEKAAGGKIVPLCPFIKAYVEEHPEYDSLLATTTQFDGRRGGPEGGSVL
jgi:predicted GNAT family acetyltransferase